NPSAQVIEAIGRALRLTPDARGHLYRLARLTPSLAPATPRDRVHPSLLQLVDAFPRAAAYVLGPAFDLLATNRIADALLSPFGGELNMVRILFTHPQAKTVFTEWPSVARNTVQALRLNAGYFPADRDLAALANEITDTSPEFRALWEEQAVGSLTRAFKVFVHPEV